MVIKINNKPIKVEEDDGERWWKEVDWMYIAVSGIGCLMGLWVVDYAAYIFVGYHPFDWIIWVGKVIHWIGGIF